MKYALLKSTALAALLAAGLSTGAVAETASTSTDAKGPQNMGNNTHAATKADVHNNTDITWETVMGSDVMTSDDQNVGRVINAYQGDGTAEPYVIIDRGVEYDGNRRFVPVRRDSLSMTGDRSVSVVTTREQFDAAPAYSATSVNEVETWPNQVDSYWEEDYVSDRPLNVTAAGRVDDGTGDLSNFTRTYNEPGNRPSN